MNEERDEEDKAGNPHPHTQARQIETGVDEELRCVQCNAPVPDVVCGRKSYCPSCGIPYPLGDCSDLAEN